MSRNGFRNLVRFSIDLALSPLLCPLQAHTVSPVQTQPAWFWKIGPAKEAVPNMLG
jgi:hypothetical protein